MKTTSIRLVLRLVLLGLSVLLLPGSQTVQPVTSFKSLGFSWDARDGSGYGDTGIWSAKGVSSTKTRITLNPMRSGKFAPVGVRMEPKGYGTYTVDFEIRSGSELARLDQLDPGPVVAVWLRDDRAVAPDGPRPKGYNFELTWEYSCWGSPEAVLKEQYTCYDLADVPVEPVYRKPSTAYLYQRVVLYYSKGYQSVRRLAKKLDGSWRELGWNGWKRQALEGATLRVGVWRPLFYSATKSPVIVVVTNADFAPLAA